VDLGLLYEVPRPHSVGVLGTRNRLVAETDNRQHSQETDSNPGPSKQAVAQIHAYSERQHIYIYILTVKKLKVYTSTNEGGVTYKKTLMCTTKLITKLVDVAVSNLGQVSPLW